MQGDAPHLLLKTGHADFCRNDALLTAGGHDLKGQRAQVPPGPAMPLVTQRYGRYRRAAPCRVGAGGGMTAPQRPLGREGWTQLLLQPWRMASISPITHFLN